MGAFFSVNTDPQVIDYYIKCEMGVNETDPAFIAKERADLPRYLSVLGYFLFVKLILSLFNIVAILGHLGN